MASFTDTQPPRFNPYIQQQPVEAMVAVGTQKQKAHDEGVQKIQTQIDNLAAIDVGRDVDKAYLQSKINEMGNSLRSVAAGDFGNFQLVNSVGGMIKQIGYDPYIRTAVASTANDRNQTALMEEDRKSGKLTPHSEYYYGLKRNKYYSNNSLKGEGGRPIGFSGKYVQSWDIDKALVEAINAVGDSKWSADQVYKMIDGQIMKDKNGNPILSDYAIKTKREGKFNENVSAAINNVLNRPEAKQELTMRGVYNYKGYDNIEDFVQRYEKEKNTAITKYEERKLELMEKAAGVTSKEEKLAYQKAIDEVDGEIEKTKADTELLESDARQFNNVEGYKAALETIKTRNGYMKSGVTEQTSTEIIENIPWKASRQVLTEERNFAMQKDASARGWAGIEISREGKDIERAKLALEAQKWEFDPKNPKNKLGSSQAVLPLGNKYESVHGNLINAANAVAADMEKSKYGIVLEYMTAINHGNGKDLSQEQIEKSIKAWEKKVPGFIDTMYGRAKGVANDPKRSVNPLYSKLMSALPSAYNAEAAQEDIAITTKNMNNSKGVRDAGGAEVDVATIAKNFKPFDIEYVADDDNSWFTPPTKTKKTVTAQDALDLAIVAKNTGTLKGIWKSITNTEVQKQQYDQAQARLQAKFGTDGQHLLRVADRGSILGTLAQSVSPYVSRKDVTHPELAKVMNITESAKFDKVLEAKEKYLRDTNWSAQPVAYSLYDVDMKGPERTSVDDRMKEVLHKYSASGAVAEFNKLYTNPKEYSAQISIDRGSPYSPKEDWKINLYTEGGVVKTLPISREDAEYIKQYQINLPQMASKTAQRLLAGGDTTNATGLSPTNPNAYKGALISGQVFTEKFNKHTRALGADVVKSPSGEFHAYIYVEDPVSGHNIGVPVKRDKGDAYPAPFNTQDDATRFLMEGIESKAFLDNVINNGLSY